MSNTFLSIKVTKTSISNVNNLLNGFLQYVLGMCNCIITTTTINKHIHHRRQQIFHNITKKMAPLADQFESLKENNSALKQ